MSRIGQGLTLGSERLRLLSKYSSFVLKKDRMGVGEEQEKAENQGLKGRGWPGRGAMTECESGPCFTRLRTALSRHRLRPRSTGLPDPELSTYRCASPGVFLPSPLSPPTGTL